MAIKRLLARRNSCIAKIKFQIEKIMQTSDESDDDAITVRISNFKRLIKDFREIMFALEDEDEFEQQHSVLLVKEENELEETIIAASAHLLKFKPDAFNETLQEHDMTVAQEEEVGIKASFKLPNIEIPTFSGSYLDWSSFHDLFSSLIGNNHALADVQKLHYLKNALKGEAAGLVKHLRITAENYKPAWKILSRRYQNTRALVNSHLNTFFSMPKLTQEDADGLKNLVNNTNEFLQSLQNLKIPVENWDPIIIFTLVEKLDIKTHSRWEEALNAQVKLPTLPRFLTFLETRFRILEETLKKEEELSTTLVANSNVWPPRSLVNTSDNNNQNQNNQNQNNQNHNNQNYNSQNQNRSNRNQTNNFNKSRNNNQSCSKCNGEHWLYFCPEFQNFSVQNRQKFVSENALCFKCLQKGHTVVNCRSRYTCRVCNQNHNSLLHVSQSNPFTRNNNQPNIPINPQNNQVNQSAQSNQNNQLINQSVSTQASASVNNSHVLPSELLTENMPLISNHALSSKIALLATAIIPVVSKNGSTMYLKALIDQGSQTNFVTTSACQKLGLHLSSVHIPIYGIGGTVVDVVKSATKIKIGSLQNKEFSYIMDALVMKTISNVKPPLTIKYQQWEHLKGLSLADPKFIECGCIDLLLGAEIYVEILLNGIQKGPCGTPMAQQTKLGWILSGPISNQINPMYSNLSTVTAMTTKVDIDASLRRFWELEEMISNKEMLYTEEEKLCEKIYAETTQRESDGRYVVRLPLKEGAEDLGESRSRAMARWIQMEKKFAINSDLHGKYSAVMQEYLDLGHMRPMTDEERSSTATKYYLPHHAVIKESSSTTKVRVVFDASAKTSNGQSLNDNLLVGPTIQNDLYTLILNWRLLEYVILADAEKMYRQIKVAPADQRFQCLVWRPNLDGPIVDYVLETVTFGEASAPFQAVRTLFQLADDEENEFPIAASVLKRNFYVDDCMAGANSITQVIKLLTDLTSLCAKGGFVLRKWVSNHVDILNAVPEEHQEVKATSLMQNDDTIKALGVFWHPRTDHFQFQVKVDTTIMKMTKRKFLSEVAKLFDPHGWISPCIIKAKIMFQKLWIED